MTATGSRRYAAAVAATVALTTVATVAGWSAQTRAETRSDADPAVDAVREVEGVEAIEEIEEVEEIEEIEEIEEVAPAVVGDAAAEPQGGTWELVGRLHPSLVHFPIAWLLLLVLLDLFTFALRREALAPVGLGLLGLTALSFVPAVATGLLRGEVLEEQAALHDLVETHETLMLVTAGLVAAALVLRLARRDRLTGASRAVYLGLIVGAAALVAVGAHWGGKIVFGPGALPF